MYKYKLLLILSLLTLTATAPLKAQQLQASLSHYSTDDGLASNAIAQILQDDYGYLWLATWNGLSRFDGYEFYNYKTGNASHIRNLHNRIAHTVLDLQQNIWMRMYDGRVFVLNRQADKIINPFKNVSGSDEYRVSCNLFTMSNGDVLSAIDGVGMYRMKLDKGEPDMQFITTAQLKVNCIAEGYHDDIWVGTNKGLHRIDIGNMSVERSGLFENEEVTAIYSNGYNIYVGCQSGAIYLYSYGQEPRQLKAPTGMGLLKIFVDSHGIIWFADTRYGTNRFIPETNNEKHFQQYVPVPEHDGYGGEFNEALGTVWMLMNHGGYGYYNRQTDEVEYFHNDPSNPWNLSNTVYASCELPEGVVFLSTSRRGLEKLELLKNNITRTLLVPNAEKPIANEVRGMLYDQKRRLLLMGNKDNTLFVIHPDSTRTVITHDSKGNPIGRTYGISMDSKGNYWLSSKDHGLFKMTPNGTSFDIRNYCHDDNNKYSLSSDAAYQTVEDPQGNIWIATYGGGVNVLTRNKEGQEVVLNYRNDLKRYYPRNSFLKVRTIARAKDGKIWAGSTDGILIMELKNHKISIERLGNSKQYPDKILQSTDIVCMASDRNGDMWVGTNGGGLARAVGTDDEGVWTFESFGSKDGLPSEEIKSIAFDLENNVWFATDHILCSYNTSKKIFTTFSNLDGVDETICSESAAITLPNGNILIGTVNGYYTVDRNKLITNNGSLLKLRITDFYMNDELISPNLNSYYDFYVPDAKRVELPQHNTVFSFRFAAMNYQLQHRIHYQYMLEGYDMEWQNADKSRMVSYADVPTGTYVFKVKAFLLESPEKFDMKSIVVVVPPFFLLSSHAIWLYMAIFMITALAVMFLRQIYIRRIQQMKVLKLGPQEMAFANPEDYNFVKSQLDWLETHFSSPDLNVDAMIEQSGIDRDVYIKQMKELIGQSPKEFIIDFRLKKAIMYLENTDDGINEIAEHTGFADAMAFTRIFKFKTGLTPSKYREQKRKESGRTEEKTEKEEKTDDYELID